MGKKEEVIKTQSTQDFPPVVAVLGHVDHGKTTLLDAVRKSTIAEGEIGGITQKIGASSIEVMHDGTKRRLTFIDTPGHQTFSAMRLRGAKVADIGLLIVSSQEGVMPQTKESISVLKKAGIPMIVVFTKVDLPEKQIEKTKQQLLKEEVFLEGLGGDVPTIEVSAKTNKNIHELLELILLVYELHGDMFMARSKDAPFTGTIIESRLDPKIGPRATVIIKNGTIHVRDVIMAEEGEVKVRSLITDKNKQVQQASVGDAVEILGFTKVPPVGSIVSENSDSQKTRKTESFEFSEKPSFHHDEQALSIVLVADTIGSLEAITAAFSSKIVVALQKTGDITASDVFLAKSTGSIIVGFHAGIKSDVKQLGRTEKVLMKNYTIIYELLEEIQDVLDGKALALEEIIFGKAKVLASFPFDKTKVLGIVVLEGRVAKGDRVRIMRGDDIIGESTISSVRQGKNQISKIEEKKEGGIILSPFLDFTIGDMLICHR
ncbi:MAG: GTP-binding protein [Candidatus Levybacteria bacterium]|nr:GTP-binding protein [Candidatus Levybacteria bacterium]